MSASAKAQWDSQGNRTASTRSRFRIAISSGLSGEWTHPWLSWWPPSSWKKPQCNSQNHRVAGGHCNYARSGMWCAFLMCAPKHVCPKELLKGQLKTPPRASVCFSCLSYPFSHNHGSVENQFFSERKLILEVHPFSPNHDYRSKKNMFSATPNILEHEANWWIPYSAILLSKGGQLI